MSTKGGPGQGATLGLSVDTTLSRLRSIQLPNHSTEPVDFSGLSDTTWFCFLAASLKNGGQFVAEMYMNSEIAIPTVGTVQTATITLPIQTSGNGTAWDIEGTGFITDLGLPNAAVGEPLIQTVTFQFDGNTTAPTVTIEAA